MRLFGTDPITLDPAQLYRRWLGGYIVEIVLRSALFRRELNLIPDIAESFDVSDDGTVYRSIYAETSPSTITRDAIVADDFKFAMGAGLEPRHTQR